MMSDYLGEDASAHMQAQYELRRIDHLIYVSLKYTRTVDVLKSIIIRLIATLDFFWDDMINTAEKQQKIFDKPSAPASKIAVIKKLYASDEKMNDIIDYYMMLRQFNNAEYTAQKEFRRNVTMVAVLQSGEQRELDIDTITEYYTKAKEYVEYLGKTYYK